LHKFITTKCNMSSKRVYFHSVERNCPKNWEKIPMGQALA
jgi:hypothetical protein